ncbi:MAG: hypothetical protein AMXMBFR46_28980 [Acidimicrobiia bacterium]
MSQTAAPEPAWIALGANLGDPPTTIARALRGLAALPDTRLEAVSTLTWTRAVGPPQPDILNGVCRVRTSLPPRALLARLQALERAAGRVPRERWGPRTLDLDLIFHGDRRLDTPELVLPHPRWHEREFVCAPLAELEGESFVSARRA